MQTAPGRLLSAEAIAQLLDLNPAHVRDRLTKRSDFPAAYRVGGTLRWKPEDIESWLEARRLNPSARQRSR